MAVFACTVDSWPLAHLALFRGELLLASSRGHQLPSHGRLRAKATANSLQLELRELDLGDSGNYRCEATNTLGSANASLFFQVRGECSSSEHMAGPGAAGLLWWAFGLGCSGTGQGEVPSQPASPLPPKHLGPK